MILIFLWLGGFTYEVFHVERYLALSSNVLVLFSL